MGRRVLLWVDLTLKRERVPSTRHFDDFFVIKQSLNRTGLDSSIDCRPDALCFDFDFPDKAGLNLLEKTKQDHPSIPILMLTVQHSEELAVWAFRARVWDYFAKPVSREDVERCYESLLRINSDRPRDSARITPPVPAENDVRRVNDSNSALIPAISYVESHVRDKISERTVAGLCHMSVYQFSRSFHAAFGQTFQNYLMSYRVERARELLKNPQARIADVAFLVGFRDASYFSKVFRRYHDMTPSQWQQAWQVDSPTMRMELAYPEPPPS